MGVRESVFGVFVVVLLEELVDDIAINSELTDHDGEAGVSEKRAGGLETRTPRIPLEEEKLNEVVEEEKEEISGEKPPTVEESPERQGDSPGK